MCYKLHLHDIKFIVSCSSYVLLMIFIFPPKSMCSKVYSKWTSISEWFGQQTLFLALADITLNLSS